MRPGRSHDCECFRWMNTTQNESSSITAHSGIRPCRLLLVITHDTVRAFSLARMPQREWGDDFDRRCLVVALDVTTHALEVSNLIYGAESGRLWKEHAEYFNSKERIDEVLLGNLNASHQELCKGNLSTDAAQALLIQAMFIAYLEDREIITKEYFEGATRKKADSFSALLESRDVKLLKTLFSTLRDDFNGDLFVAPCSFESASRAPTVTEAHLVVLARFRSGREEMAKGGQFRFWGYDFRYIPIELVSAVYDRFLGEREDERKAQGAYYTPMFLADTVVSQLWDVLPATTREKGHFLDPACGSGVFLVRSFQRLCEHWRTTRQARTIRWDSLLSILKRVHGWDLNGSAVRVAVFSLYVALLEEVSPPDIRAMVKRGKLLPELWGKTLVRRDFFDDANKELASFDVLLGNPPWTSRRGQVGRRFAGPAKTTFLCRVAKTLGRSYGSRSGICGPMDLLHFWSRQWVSFTTMPPTRWKLAESSCARVSFSVL